MGRRKPDLAGEAVLVVTPTPGETFSMLHIARASLPESEAVLGGPKASPDSKEWDLRILTWLGARSRGECSCTGPPPESQHN